MKFQEINSADECTPCKVIRKVCSTTDSLQDASGVIQEAIDLSVIQKPISPVHFNDTTADNTCVQVLDSSAFQKENTYVHNKNHDPETTNTDPVLIKENYEFDDFNEAFDAQFEEIFISLSEDAKERNPESLADETESVLYDSTAATHFSAIVVDNIEICKKKETDQNEDPCAKELYPDAPHTLGVTVLLICCFLIRFRLSEEALSYMLRLLACILPHGHRLMGSLYYFRNMTHRFAQNLIPTIHYYCNRCYSVVEKKDKTCGSCGLSLTRSGSIAYFLQLRLASQLASLWKNRDVCDTIRSHRFQHFAENKEKLLKDIYDGLLYQKLFSDNGLLSDPNNISLSLNTDGAPIFKSSNVSIWPVYLLINELPIAQRKKRSNSLFYGIWISSSKPIMWAFLKPLYEELDLLETKGYSFTDHKGEEFISKCVLLTCTCDLPARALVYNCNQFNGGYSCWHCLQPGETFKHDTGGISHIFPFDKNNPKGPVRTKETIMQDTDQAVRNVRQHKTKSSVNGHKGKFWFMFLNSFDYVNSCVIDYMHGVCLGVVKTLLTIWFDKKNKNNESSYFEKRNEVNCLLRKITPTIFVSRIPRTLDELPHWKASEFRNFLLYWGLPVLRHILDPDHFAHFCLLVRSIFILSKEGISSQEMQIADAALLLFVENFKELYGDRYFTLNMHQLVHLADCVKYTGPLYVNNCFIFEDLNGFIVKHIHGTQGIDTQITNIVSLLQVPVAMSAKYLKGAQEDAMCLFHELNGSDRHLHEIEAGIGFIGTASIRTLNAEEQRLVLKFGVRNTEVKEFLKINMYKKGFYVYGSNYSRLEKRQQHIITYQKGNELEFASVLSFVQCEERSPRVIFNLAVIKPFKKIVPLGCVWEVSREDHIDFIPIQTILNVNNIVTAVNKVYLCPSPNRYDRD